MNAEDRSDQVWEMRMLPLMAKMLLGLTIFFFVVSLLQLSYLHWTIRQAPTLDSERIAIRAVAPETFEQELRVAQFETLAEFDLSAMERRHHQANVLLMSRVWTRYMGFVTGMILALVGATFTLGKLRASRIAGPDPAGPSGLIVASPGLLLTLLGTVLMTLTIGINHRIEVYDAPVFTRILVGGPVDESLGSLPDLPSLEEIRARSDSIGDRDDP